MRVKKEKASLKKGVLVTGLYTRTVTEAVGIYIILSFNSTFGAEFLPFYSDITLNFSSTTFTFSHVISPLN
jgi:hypothetical protein